MNTKVTLRPVNGHPIYKHRVTFPDGGKRRSKLFKLKKDAVVWSNTKKAELAAYGAKHQPISEEERRAVAMFREFAAEIPEAMRPTLSRAIEHYIDHARLRNTSLPCAEIADKLISLKIGERIKPRSVDDLVSRLGRFTELYGDWLACDVSTEIIDEFLEDLNTSPQNELNYRSKVSQLFNYAITIKACDENPVKNARKVEKDGYDVGILTPSETAAYLSAANDTVVSGIANGCFAGLRESEIQRLDWSQVDLESRRIQVKALGAKKKRRRSVHISDNLQAWLLPHAKRRGAVIGEVPYQWRKGKELAREDAGITEWLQNAARHSYASYHMEAVGDAGKTALQMGHVDQRVIYDHYFELVTPKVAKIYWSIVPEKIPNVTNIKAS